MIVFLTLCYVGVLALALKLGLIKLTLWWKLSPLAWMLLLFVLLFLPMQWGAPGGRVNSVQFIVEIVPNVTGQVVEVPVKPLETVDSGDVLFRIDPVPFQAKVDQLQAQLAAAIQNVEQLRANADATAATVTNTEQELDVKKAEIVAAGEMVTVAQSSAGQAEANLDKATKLVTELEVQVAASGRELERRTELLAKGAGSQSEVDQIRVQNSTLVSQLNSAEADLIGAEQLRKGSLAALEAEKASLQREELQLKQTVDAELPRVRAIAREAKLAAEAMIGDEHATVAEVRAQLAAAQFDLDQTVVRAPAKGHVSMLTLRPGQRVANLPFRSWMAFVDHGRTDIVVSVQQYALRHVRPGQKAEVTFKVLPGRVFNATVDRINYSTSAGQISPSGQLASSGSVPATPERFGVVIDIDDDSLDINQIPGGAAGSAAIYTNSMQATHVIRRVMIRMDAWMNYLIP